MLNPNGIVKTTATSYFLQFMWNTSEYYSANFYVTTKSLESMYRNKYSRNYYDSTLHPFKVEVIQ